MQEMQVTSLSQENLWRRKCQSTPVFLPGESHRQRGLVGYGPQGHKDSDMTEQLALLLSHILLSTRGEGFRAAWQEDQDLLMQTWGLLYDLDTIIRHTGGTEPAEVHH